jgi:hypothetical protein
LPNVHEQHPVVDRVCKMLHSPGLAPLWGNTNIEVIQSKQPKVWAVSFPKYGCLGYSFHSLPYLAFSNGWVFGPPMGTKGKDLLHALLCRESHVFSVRALALSTISFT